MRYFVLFFALILTGCATTQNAVERAAITKSKLGFPVFEQFEPNAITRVDHGALDQFLSKYLVAPQGGQIGVNLIRYADVSEADHQALKAYIDRLEATNVSALNRSEQLAFWINLYNAQTINVIVEAYPVDSIRAIKSSPLDFKGPWNDKALTVEGVELTLDDIENKIIRPVFNDARIHYAVNCAAIGCPNLKASAYRGTGLDAVLDAQARAYINDPRGVSVAEGNVTASRIFLWYKEDFGDSESAILDHIRRYADPDLVQALTGISEIKSYEYEWALNAVK